MDAESPSIWLLSMCTFAARAENTNTFRGDVAIGDVNLTAILGRDRITIEFQIAIVDLQEAIALADDRIMPALDRGARRGRSLTLGSGGYRALFDAALMA